MSLHCSLYRGDAEIGCCRQHWSELGIWQRSSNAKWQIHVGTTPSDRRCMGDWVWQFNRDLQPLNTQKKNKNKKGGTLIAANHAKHFSISIEWIHAKIHPLCRHLSATEWHQPIRFAEGMCADMVGFWCDPILCRNHQRVDLLIHFMLFEIEKIGEFIFCYFFVCLNRVFM